MAGYNTVRFIEHLKTKWGGRPCPMCQLGPWEIQDSIYQLMQFNNGNLVIGGPILPLIPIVCKNCGHTVLVNAIISGAMPPSPPPPSVPSTVGLGGPTT